jgi:hypothetical protein
MPRRGRTRASDLLVLERRATVFRLKQSGATYAAIASMMQASAAWHGRLPQYYTEREVYRDVKAELQRQRTALAALVDDVRQEELARLDALQVAFWSRATSGDAHAAALVLDLMARRARYWPGLEQPVAVEVTAGDGLAALLKEWTDADRPRASPDAGLPGAGGGVPAAP